MTDIPEKRGPVAIKIEGGRNIRLDNNVSVGMPLLDATNVENLTGTGNTTMGYAESAQAPPSSDPATAPRKFWRESAAGKAITTLVLAVAAAGIIYALGWN